MLQNIMFNKRLVVPLCDFRSRPLEELSPIKENPLLFSEQVERDKRHIKKKAVETIGVKSAEILLVNEEDKENNESDEDFDTGNEDKENNESDEDFDTGDVTLSDYEKMIEKNRAQRMAILESLKIDEIKAEFCEAVNIVKKKLQPEKRKWTKRVKISPPVLRKSRRLANVSASLDLSEEAVFSKALNKAKEMETGKQIPPELSFKVALQFGKSYEEYAKDLNIQNSNTQLKYFSYDRSIIKCLTLHDSDVAKVTPGRITAAAWHPDPDSLIFSAGDAYGSLGILKVGSESSSYIFQTHKGTITNLMFNALNPSHLVSSSCRGTLRCGDMVKHVFNEVYNNETSCTYFDFLSQRTYIIAQGDGQVVLVDDRSPRRRSQKKHTCHEHSIKTVHVHPVNKCVFVTAETKGPVRLWDLRKLQQKPVVDIQYHKKCVSSAYFSPITGNSILTTSLDNTLSIFDSTSLTKDIKLRKSIEHNNHRAFRATWLPNSEEAFVIGGINAQHRIELYDKDMNIYHVIITHKNLQIRSLNIFHPGRPALAEATLTGNVVIFTPR